MEVKENAALLEDEQLELDEKVVRPRQMVHRYHSAVGAC